ncbi:hypothetical protein C8R43DRAFT_957851 [Mycena crocata]|nr:hypothetical protein C8R43DRAFT_957851 [Mycena crocata]
MRSTWEGAADVGTAADNPVQTPSHNERPPRVGGAGGVDQRDHVLMTGFDFREVTEYLPGLIWEAQEIPRRGNTSCGICALGGGERKKDRNMGIKLPLRPPPRGIEAHRGVGSSKLNQHPRVGPRGRGRSRRNRKSGDGKQDKGGRLRPQGRSVAETMRRTLSMRRTKDMWRIHGVAKIILKSDVGRRAEMRWKLLSVGIFGWG